MADVETKGELENVSSTPEWYVVHTYSGYENKVKIDLENTSKNRNLQDKILEVAIPQQSVTEIKGGAKKAVDRKLIPGYVLIRMVMNEETWYVVRNTRGVTGFVGPGSKPVPLSEEELQALYDIPQGELVVDLKEGDMVVVTDDPTWKDSTGVILSINESKETVTISVDMSFGATAVTLALGAVKKL